MDSVFKAKGLAGPFRLDSAYLRFHDHGLDNAFRGPLRRLPDRTIVRAEDYEARLAEYEAAKRARNTGD
jgi:hypothetical protein